MLIQQLSSKPKSNITTAITAHGVGMVFKSDSQKFQALADINLSIPKGDIQLLMGPSGSGKTTLISILAGLMTPTAGNIQLLGEEITSMSRKQLTQFRRHNIGFVFQGFNLFPALTAAENVEVSLNIKGIGGRKGKNEAQMLLAAVGLEDKGKMLPKNLSGGQKQRVAIARALAGDPQLIMADEPTAALDSQSGQAIVEILHQLAKKRGATVLIVTHDPRIVNVADSILYLEDGRLQPPKFTPTG
ncbi:MAG: ABC transporter ATP-binding protein [Gomphosphaeria aponina SAG 52.96 = DSM 107014]|uniref:ABC transporter ATP-binding protein n=1 Tax=Gomphosphaeria aponina SAG 52.96 = DSM 107014 TaxID=1521640 RepID=A0A941GPI4_9CHRO|nr:ABC transporter ATP-binding protein [Gomphosphaeria aponina SAG 52.96 = DSM 107014]